MLHGHIENGLVVLDEPNPLPDGTPVVVERAAPTNGRAPDTKPRTLAELFDGLIGVVDDLPEDMAAQHDHYIHGTPKR